MTGAAVRSLVRTLEYGGRTVRLSQDEAALALRLIREGAGALGRELAREQGRLVRGGGKPARDRRPRGRLSL